MNIQSIPQVIMAGLDIGAMSRDELKAHVIHLGPSPASDAQTVVAMMVDGARRDVEGKW